MKYMMRKNENGFTNSKKFTVKNDEYTNMMLYSIAEKLIIFYEVFLPEYKRFVKAKKLSARKIYRLINKSAKNLAYSLRRTGVLVIADVPFASLRNKLCAVLPYNKKRMFTNLAINLYKFSILEDALKTPFCNDDYKFDFDFTRFDGRDITVQVAEVDCSIINSAINSDADNKFDGLANQLEKAFKKIETKDDLAMYLGQFFNFEEDINDCFRIAGKKAC